MEELKVIIDMIASLPQLALWVLVGFWAYKVIVIGSIYGTVKFISQKVYEVATKPKEMSLEGLAMNKGVANFLHGQVSRIATTNYISHSDVVWLADAITEKAQRENKNLKEPKQ
jgi:phage FluMu gp28-like protein